MKTSFKKIAGLTTSAVLASAGVLGLNIDAAHAIDYVSSPITVNFEKGDTSGYALGGDIDFGGNKSNHVAKIVNGFEGWSGTTFMTLTTGELLSDTSKVVTLKFYTETAGQDVVLKFEGAGDAIEVHASAVTVVGWQTLTFDATSKYVAASTYSKVSLFADFFGPTHVANSSASFFFDDVVLAGATTPVTVTFEKDDTSGYALGGSTDFGGNSSGQVAQIVNGFEGWSGTTFMTLIDGGELLSDTSKVVTLKFYTETAGQDVVLKFEGTGEPIEVHASAVTVVGWQTLTFDATSKYVAESTYSKVSLFADFFGPTHVANSSASFFFDDVVLAGATKASTPIVRTNPVRLINFEGSEVYDLSSLQFNGLVASVSDSAPAHGSLGSTKAAKFVSAADAGQCANGTTFFVGAIGESLLSAGHTTVTANVYAENIGQVMLLKFENGTNPESRVTTTKVGWQKVTFDYTAGFNEAIDYNKMSFFPDFTCGGAPTAHPSSNTYIDDIAFNGATSAAIDAVVLPVSLSASASVKGKVTVTVKNANGRSIKVVVAGGKTVKKTANSDNYVINITTKKGSHKVTVTVGAKKLVKTLKVK